MLKLQLFNKLSRNPSLLDQITIQFLTGSPSIHHPISIHSKHVQHLLRQLLNCAISQHTIQYQTQIRKSVCFMALLNALRIIISSTFKHSKGNKFINGVQMLFCTYLEKVSNIIKGMCSNALIPYPASKSNTNFDMKALMKFITYSLLISRIMMKIEHEESAELTTCFPELLRFLILGFQNITTIIKANLHDTLFIIKIHSKRNQNKELPEFQIKPNKQNEQKQQLLGKYQFSDHESKNNQDKERKRLSNTSHLDCFHQLLARDNISIVSMYVCHEIIEFFTQLIKKFKRMTPNSGRLWEMGVMRDFYEQLTQLSLFLKDKQMTEQDIFIGKSNANSYNKKTKSDASSWECQTINLKSSLSTILQEGEVVSDIKQNQLRVSQRSIQNIQIRELTPRMYDQEPSAKLNKLRSKKKKLEKKIQSDIRMSAFNRGLEDQVRSEVRESRAKKVIKKEKYVLDKQTEQAKKYNHKMKIIKKKQKVLKSAGRNKGNGRK